MVDGHFNCVTYHIKVLGWLEKKEERKRKKEDKQYWILAVSGRPP